MVEIFMQEKLERFHRIIKLVYNMEQKNEIQPTSAQVIPTQNPSVKNIRPQPTISHLVNSFFEVTINSQKLSTLFSNIDEIMFEQNRKIELLSRDINSLSNSLDEKIQVQSKKTALLFTKLDLRINESANTQYCYVMDIHKKSEQRDVDLAYRLETVNREFGKFEDTFRQDLNEGLANLKRQIIGDVKIISQSEIDSNQPSDKQIPTINTPKIDFNYLIEHFEQEMLKLKEGIMPIFEQLFEQKENQKKKKHTQDMIDLTYKKQIQNFKENMKGDQNYLKIIYPTNNKKVSGVQQKEEGQIQREIPIKLKKIRHLSFNKNTGVEEILHGYNQVLQKIHGLEEKFKEQINSIGQVKNKEVVMNEKINILNRKLEKNCFETAEVKTSIRRVQNQKLDEKVIEELRNYIKWAVRDLEEKLHKKCTDEDLQKQKNRITQKLAILHENLIEKADKGQIQKALVFLEGKIKEIIFLIAAEQTEQKEGAIMKTAAKCLSCDKQVQRQMTAELDCKRDLAKQTQGQYIKSMTHRVRQRYRKQMAKTVGNQTFDN